MTKRDRVPPTLDATAFTCPHCRVYAMQHWDFMYLMSRADRFGSNEIDRRFRVSRCEACEERTIWLGDKMIYPLVADADPPADDLPGELRDDFEEARLILQHSPRGAAALLRLVIQKLCVQLGQSGKDINGDIKALVAAGLPSQVQKALDIVRVIGNESVHPGTIDLRDNRETALQLFRLVNFIVEKMITEPKQIEELYAILPPNKLEGIKNRDAVR